MRNLVPFAVLISLRDRHTPPVRCGLTPATNRAFFLSRAKSGVGSISPPRNGAMSSSAGCAVLRVKIAGTHNKPAAAAPAPIICRRVTVIIPEPQYLQIVPVDGTGRFPATRPGPRVVHLQPSNRLPRLANEGGAITAARRCEVSGLLLLEHFLALGADRRQRDDEEQQERGDQQAGADWPVHEDKRIAARDAHGAPEVLL